MSVPLSKTYSPNSLGKTRRFLKDCENGIVQFGQGRRPGRASSSLKYSWYTSWQQEKRTGKGHPGAGKSVEHRAAVCSNCDCAEMLAWFATMGLKQYFSVAALGLKLRLAVAWDEFSEGPDLYSSPSPGAAAKCYWRAVKGHWFSQPPAHSTLLFRASVTQWFLVNYNSQECWDYNC